MTDSKIETYVVDTENIPKKAIELIKKLTNYRRKNYLFFIMFSNFKVIS